ARVLGDVARQAPGLARELRQRPPARRARPAGADRGRDVLGDRAGAVVEVHGPGDALDLSRRQAERLAEVARSPPRLVAGEGGHEGRALAPVALVDAHDQPLADIAREVEVYVRHLGRLFVQEAAQKEGVSNRVHVREAGQVADDRADAGAAAAAGREEAAGGARAAHLGRDLAGELEDVEVEQEEPGEAERADDAELLLQAARGLAALPPRPVAMLEAAAADLRQGPVRLRVLGARVAVAEVAGEVEAEALRERGALGEGLRVVGEAARHLLRRRQARGRVAAAKRLALVQRDAVADGHEGVLELGPPGMVEVGVAGRHAGDAQALREVGERAVAGAVVAPEGALKLDPEALAPEGG